MPFATALESSLQTRQAQVPEELAHGDSLEHVLSRHLRAVERMASREILTSILLVDPDGRRLRNGAAPNLPDSYWRAIDGVEVGPRVGSCGTAAYFGRPVYCTDIATDPLWEDYRHLALPLGIRACWSIPIRDDDGAVIGTFAIHHRTVGGPSRREIEAIEMIAGHVARAIMLARDCYGQAVGKVASPPPALRLVASTTNPAPSWADGLLRSVERLEAHAEALERLAALPESERAADALAAAAEDCRKLIAAVRSQIDFHRD